MTFSTPNPITGWSPTVKSASATLSDVDYTVTTSLDSSIRMFGARATLPLIKNSQNRRWYWEIDIVGTPSPTDIIVIGIATTTTSVEPLLNFLSNLPNTLYVSDGRINGSQLTFPPFTGGDNIAFALDYDEKNVEAFLNGISVGFLTEELNDSFEYFPYFASNKTGLGCFLRDGAREEISTNTNTFNLREPFDQPIPPAVPLDLAFKNDVEEIALRAVPYFFTNPIITNEIAESNLVNVLIPPDSFDYKQIRLPFNALIKEDFNPVSWSNLDSAAGIFLTNRNLTATGSLIGSIRTGSFRTSGKWYFEYEIVTGANNISVGVGRSDASINQFVGDNDHSWGISNGNLIHDSILTPIAETILDGDIINVAIDLDANLLWFGINNTYINSGDPIAGTNPSFIEVTGIISPMVSTQTNSSWEVSAHFSNVDTLSVEPSGFDLYDGTDGPLPITGTSVFWNENSVTGGMTITNGNLTATSTVAGSVMAIERVNATDTNQVWMEFHIDDSTALTGVGVTTPSETILYQSDGSLGSFNQGAGITWNPSVAALTWQFFNNNTQAGDIGFSGMAKATEGKSSGKWYWEIRMEPQSDALATIIGVTISSSSVNDYPGEVSGSGIGYYALDGTLKNEGVSSAFGSSYTGGDIINFALDMDVGSLWIGKNGVYPGGGVPSTGTNPAVTGLSGTIIPAVGDFTDTTTETVAVTANFGQFFFTTTIPTGFIALGPIHHAGTFPTYTSDDVIGLGIDANNGNIVWSNNQQFIDPGLTLLLDLSSTLAEETGNITNFIEFGTLTGDFNLAKFDTSIKFPDNSYIEVPNNPGFLFGLGDFTIECQMLSIGGLTIASTWDGGVSHSWIIRHLADQKIEIWSGNVSAIAPLFETTGILPRDGQFHHFAFTRDAGTTRIFVDGIQIGSTTSVWNNIADATAILQIGKQPNASTGEFIGFMEDFHIVKGVSKYTTNFTPPTAPVVPQAETTMLFNMLANTTTAVATMSGNKEIKFETLNGSTTANFGIGIFEQTLFDNFEPFGCGNNGGFANVPSITWASTGGGLLREQDLRYNQDGLGIRKVSAMLGSSSKVYMEYEVISHAGNLSFGIFGKTFYFDGSLCTPDIDNCGPQTLPLVSPGDIVMMAFDELTGEGWFGLNGSWFFSGDPSANLNPTTLVSVGDELFWGVEDGPGMQGVNVKANFGSFDFDFVIPLGYVAFDQNVLPGKDKPCSATVPSLLSIADGLLIVSIEDNTTKGSFPLQRRETPDLVNVYFKSDITITDSPNLFELYTDFKIFPLHLRIPLLASFLLDDTDSAFTGIDLLTLLSGFNMFKNNGDTIDDTETTNQGNSSNTAFVLIDINDIADHSITLGDGSTIDELLLMFVKSFVVAPFVLPSVYNIIELVVNFPNTALPFTKALNFDTPSALQSTPVSIVIQDEAFFIVSFDFTKFNPDSLPLWPDLLSVLLAGINVGLPKVDLNRIVFLEPIFPVRTSGRLGG